MFCSALRSGNPSGALSRSQRPLSARVAHHAPAMRGSHVTRSLSQHATGPCHCGPEDFDPYMPHLQDHLGGHGNHGNHAYYPPGGPPQEPLPVRRLPSGYSGGTFPRSHPGQLPYDPATGPAPSPGPAHHGHTSRKSQRAPPSQMEQFDRQQLEGFHTLQYQRAGSGGEQRAERDRDRERAESPSRIRHLVHSVQRLFTKSHSLEAPAKQREFSNGRERGGAPVVPGGGAHRHPGQPQRVPRSARRSKSHDRSKSRDSRHRGRSTGWWSSDDNLDSDSGYLQASRGRRGHQSLEGAVQDLTLRSLRAPPQLGPQGDCVSCSALALPGEGGLSLRKNPNAWAAMTVSHMREGYPALGPAPAPPMGYDKALVPLEGKPKERSFHYLQVPSEDWTGAYLAGASDSGGEIPCRRMRSGSYVRAMGDDDSVESDPSPTATPKTTLLSPTATPKTALLAQREAFRRSLSMDQRPISRYSCKQCSSAYANSRTMPKNHSCNHMQLGDSMCESVFGELGESQAVDALDLPGCFRARSHSYVRAIQAGVSHDDDCLPVFSLSGPQGGAKGAAG
ncbi:hypothetical protein AGOR_G00101300 [Albula goreensis]|uniref:Uncharacterized protein n=1 Tax=Albula goreensis TaxID=1534307 RepID=A0A8T3DGL8_9TELE|nr:hypothetical protein AGOR_G00101300 [Albula goreensis]